MLNKDFKRYTDEFIACHGCDLLHPVKRLQHGEVAQCIRCGGVLYQQRYDSLNRTLAFALTGLILFVLANLFPLLTFDIDGRTQSNHLLDGSLEFFNEGYWELGIVVFLFSFLVPLLSLVALLALLIPLKLGYIPNHLKKMFRFMKFMKPWAMSEVFILGIIVAYVKLADFAVVTAGSSLVAFVLMVIVTVLANVVLDARIVWKISDDIGKKNQ